MHGSRAKSCLRDCLFAKLLRFYLTFVFVDIDIYISMSFHTACFFSTAVVSTEASGDKEALQQKVVDLMATPPVRRHQHFAIAAAMKDA